jgi:hypothetical protein
MNRDILRQIALYLPIPNLLNFMLSGRQCYKSIDPYFYQLKIKLDYNLTPTGDPSQFYRKCLKYKIGPAKIFRYLTELDNDSMNNLPIVNSKHLPTVIQDGAKRGDVIIILDNNLDFRYTYILGDTLDHFTYFLENGVCINFNFVALEEYSINHWQVIMSYPYYIMANLGPYCNQIRANACKEGNVYHSTFYDWRGTLYTITFSNNIKAIQLVSVTGITSLLVNTNIHL